MVDDKNKISTDDVSENGGACKVIVGGGVVVGQVTKGNNDDVVVAAAVDSTTVDSDHSGGGGGPVVGPETKGKDDDADAMVDDKNKISADDVSGKERDLDEIDRMQNTIRKQFMKKQYRELWGKEHGYRTPTSDQQDTVSDVTVNVDKANVDTVNKDETESDDVDEDEDEDKNEDVQVKPDDDLYSSLLPAGSGSNIESDPSEFPSPQNKSTFNRLKGFAYSQTTANPHPSPDTVNLMESAHPNPIRPSPPMPAASPTLLDTKVAAATNLLAVATTHIPLELPFESVGLRTRQRSQTSSQVTMEPRTVAAIGDLSSGIKRKRLAPPRKANKGATKKVATKKGANKKGAKDVVSKK
jgi:hypothetical protein